MEASLGDFVLLDDLFRLRAADPIQVPLLGFPRSEKGTKDFELLTGQDLNRFVDQVAKHYLKSELQANLGETVAIIGHSDLDWVVSVFGLVRAGYAVLTLSPRLSSPAIIALLKETCCQCVLYGKLPHLVELVKQIGESNSVQTQPILSRVGYDKVDSIEPSFFRAVNRNEEREKVVIIMHSSGSTGLPKPIYTKHNRYTLPSLPGPGSKDMITLPLYHAFAFTVSIQRMYHRKTIFYPNPNLPFTCRGLTEAINEARPAVLSVVPYVLKLLAEEEVGVEALKSCDQVISAGSQCPDNLGDHLVSRGVMLATYFASTETALLGTSLGRPKDDHAWAYVRPPPALLKNIWPKPLGDNNYEFVYLRGYPSLVISNSIEPPGSYHSKDIFTPHPEIPNAWKHVGRIDDRVTLLNGEKVLPLAIEGCVGDSSLVKRAIVFGISRPVPGILVIRAEAARAMSDDDFITAIYPSIESANLASESFAKIGRHMVVPLSADIDCPMTDKGSIIRPQVYQRFEREIESAYMKSETTQDGGLKLEKPALEAYLLAACQKVIGLSISDPYTDFFEAGMDSLQALELRTQIFKDLDLGSNGRLLSHNLVFETANISNLAQVLYRLAHNQELEEENPIEAMSQMIHKYAHFQKHAAGPIAVSKQQSVVLLTGATGAVGSHILAQLLENGTVKKVFCLIRGPDPISRLHNSMKNRGLAVKDPTKLSIHTSDLSQPGLGLHESDYSGMVSQVSHIVHCAWPVNFQLGLHSFEPHIAGVQNLVQISLAVPSAEAVKFIFCSSITAALGSPTSARIPEGPIEDLSYSSDLGYGRSKLVAEHIIQAAANSVHANATILRIGQVVGDQKHGMWNENEMIPMIITSGLRMGKMPLIDMECEWLPVDVLAKAILEIAGISAPASIYANPFSKRQLIPKVNGVEEDEEGVFKDYVQTKELVYNIRSPHTFSWANDLLPTLTTEGFDFEVVPFGNWLDQLESLHSDENPGTLCRDAGGNDIGDGANYHPVLKLLEYLKNGFCKDSRTVVFEIDKAMRESPALRGAPDVVKSGLVGLMIKWWMNK